MPADPALLLNFRDAIKAGSMDVAEALASSIGPKFSQAYTMDPSAALETVEMHLVREGLLKNEDFSPQPGMRTAFIRGLTLGAYPEGSEPSDMTDPRQLAGFAAGVVPGVVGGGLAARGAGGAAARLIGRHTLNPRLLSLVPRFAGGAAGGAAIPAIAHGGRALVGDPDAGEGMAEEMGVGGALGAATMIPGARRAVGVAREAVGRAVSGPLQAGLRRGAAGAGGREITTGRRLITNPIGRGMIPGEERIPLPPGTTAPGGFANVRTPAGMENRRILVGPNAKQTVADRIAGDEATLLGGGTLGPQDQQIVDQVRQSVAQYTQPGSVFAEGPPLTPSGGRAAPRTTISETTSETKRLRKGTRFTKTTRKTRRE